MKAARFSRFGGPEVLEIVELPDPHAGPGQVRIAVRAAGVNPGDRMKRQGLIDEELPQTLGHEAAGIVDEIGALLAVAGAAAVGCAAAPGLGWLACGLFTTGLAVGPVAVYCFTAVDVLAPAGAVVEAFTSVTATGLAAGTAAAGLLVTHAGPGVGFFAAAAIAVLAGVTVLGRRRTLQRTDTRRPSSVS